MARLIEFECNKTYATKQNAIKAVEKAKVGENHRYFIFQNDQGRFIPVFIGERALQDMLHFRFNVVA